MRNVGVDVDVLGKLQIVFVNIESEEISENSVCVDQLLTVQTLDDRYPQC